MKLSFDQQYLHYSKSGQVYFFYTDSNDVYMKIFQNNIVYSIIKVAENIIDYCVNIDDSGIFHLVSISPIGNLKYCIYRNNKWDCRHLTKYDTKSYKFKNLKVYVVNDHIHILVAVSNIFNPRLWILKHHHWNKRTWMNKKVCEMFIEKYDVPFQADIDPHHHIHLVFKSLWDKKYQIFYCRYNAVYNSWSRPVKISNMLQNASHPFVMADNKNGIHIIWSSFYNNNLEIFYLFNDKISSSKSHWPKFQQISNEGGNCTHPFILQIENQIKLIWKQNDRFISKTMAAQNHVWNESITINIDPDIHLSPICLIGNVYKSYSPVKVPFTYGSINEDIFLVGLDIHTSKSKKPSLEKSNNKTMVLQNSSVSLSNNQKIQNKTFNESPLPSNKFDETFSTEHDESDTKTIMYKSFNLSDCRPAYSLSLTKEIQSTSQEEFIASEENNCCNEISRVPNQEKKDRIEEMYNDFEINKIIDIIQNIQVQQEAINQLINQLNKNQEINSQKIDELLHLYFEIRENLQTPSTNNSMLVKLKSLFK